MNAHASYRQVQSHTASKERTLVLLFEAAQRHMVAGAQHLDGQQFAEANKVLGKASDIVLELWATLDHRHDPQLSQTLESVYEYVSIELTKATSSRKGDHARNAHRAFAPLVEGFSQAVANVMSGAK